MNHEKKQQKEKENSVCRDFRHTAEDGKKYTSKFYNLKTITVAGSCINSHRAIEFRNCATKNKGKFGDIV